MLPRSAASSASWLWRAAVAFRSARRYSSAMLLAAFVVAVVVVGVWWLSRSGELFYISVRDGKALVVRGRVPVSMLQEFKEAVARARRGSIGAFRTESGGQLVSSTHGEGNARGREQRYVQVARDRDDDADGDEDNAGRSQDSAGGIGDWMLGRGQLRHIPDADKLHQQVDDSYRGDGYQQGDGNVLLRVADFSARND